jgi:hypothetical protein
MKISKKILAYTAMFLTSESEVFSSSLTILGQGSQRCMTQGLRKITTRARPTTIPTSLCSQNSGGCGLNQLRDEIMELSDQNVKKINELRRYMNDISPLFEQVNKGGPFLYPHQNKEENFSRLPQTKVKTEKKLAVITPINQQNSLAVFPQHNPEFEQMTPEQDNGPLSAESFGQEVSAQNNVHNQVNDDLQIKYIQRQDLFADRIVEASNQRLNRAEVVAILDLYTSLVRYTKESITKVLNGSTDTSQSNTYSAIVRHGESKKLTLSWYRGVYTQLCEVFENNPTDNISKIAATVMRESRSLFRKRSKTRDDYLYNIVIGAHPLYPVSPEEVGLLVDVYQNLRAWKREVITKVLNGSTTSLSSNTYAAFVKHAEANNLSINFYRHIYSKLCKSEVGVDLFNKMCRNNNSTTEIEQNEASHQPNYQIEEEERLDRDLAYSEEDNINSNVDEEQIGHNISRTRGSVLPEDGNNNEIFSKGNYTISTKEKKLLRRLYSLLPEFDAKKITKALSGTTKNQSLPIWDALLEAIDQIKNEAIRDGDDTLINLKYFQRLHWASVRVTGKSGSLKNTPVPPQEEERESEMKYIPATMPKVKVKSLKTAKKDIPATMPKVKVKSLKTTKKDIPATMPKSKSKASAMKEELLAKKKGKIKSSRGVSV